MKVWLRQHRAALRGALVRLMATPLNTILSLLVISIALLLPSLGYVTLSNLATLGKNTANIHQISLYMAVNATSADVQQIKDKLEQSAPGRWIFVSRQQALEGLKKRSDLINIIDDLQKNPLPDAFIVEPDDTSPQGMSRWAQTFTEWPKIAYVQLDSAWVERFNAFIHLGQIIVILLACLFSAALIAITFNTIRLQILAQAQEIEVAKLIGATDGFIHRPYYYFGIIQGLLGGLLATFLLLSGVDYLNEPVVRIASLYGSNFTLHPPALREIAALLLLGASLGWIGAQLSVSLHLRSIETF